MHAEMMSLDLVAVKDFLRSLCRIFSRLYQPRVGVCLVCIGTATSMDAARRQPPSLDMFRTVVAKEAES